MNLPALRRWTVLLALVPLAPLFAAPGYHPVEEAEEAAKAARPRILSEAERAAVLLAVGYLERGPEAWAGRLANGSPWNRLGKGAARDEIAARAGPPDGATWQLLTPDTPDPDRAVFAIEFASGLDEILDLRLVDQGGWKIAAVRSTSDPWAGAPAGSEAVPAGGASAAEPETSPAPAPSHRAGWMALLAFLVLLIGAGGGAGAFALLLAKQKPAAIGVGAGAAVLALGVLLWGFLGHPAAVEGTGTGGADSRSPAGPRLSLGALAPLRMALASGADRGEIARRLGVAPAEAHLKEVQELWRAQQRMAEGDLAGAEATLRAFPEASPYPLADLLRARLAFRRMRRAETGWLYEKAIRHGLDNDGLRLEAGFAEAQTDEEGHAEAALKRMVERGSRLAEPWYVAAQVAASQDRLPEAEAYLKRAWQLEPVPRANLFRAPVMAALVARPALFKVFQLGIPEEVRLPPEGPRHPLPLPAGVRAATCGQALRLDVSSGRDGESSLLVPGGAEIAPADAVLEDAHTWNHHEEARAFAALPALKAQAAAGGGLPPRLLKLAEEAGAALSEEHRWNELVALTDPVVPVVETAPADLIRLRAKALHQLGRDGEAKELLLRLAKTDLAGRRPATATLLDLSELYAAAGEYDIAIKLVAKADSQLAEPRWEQRRRQLAMDRDLEASYASFDTDHFEIRYPKTNRERYARQVAWVLEEERTRLSRYIPLSPHPKRIEVHLFPIKDFYASFAGDVAVVGLFDGKLRVPFGEQRTLHPQIVSILSHELAHALMTDATHGQAPHWMQEGLAQHIETGVERFNPLPDLAESGRRLSFPTVDPILRGFAERQFVGLAYSEAAWAIAFVEARWGQPAIPRLLNSFAAGRTTEQAIQEVTGLSLAGFDRAFWAWGTGEGPRTRSLAGRAYEQEYAELENREKLDEGGLRLGRRPDEGKVRLGMSGWHARYLATTAGVKRRLPPIFGLYEKETLPVADGTACGDLAAEARKALADTEAWATPDRDVGDQLRGVYGLIADLGDACQIGQTPEARTLIKRIQVGFNRATETLAPFGVRP